MLDKDIDIENIDDVISYINNLEEDLSNIKDDLNNLRKQKASSKKLNKLESEIESVKELHNELSKEISDERIDSRKNIRKIRQRLSNVENEIGIQDWESMVPENATEIEKLTTLSREKRKEKKRLIRIYIEPQ